MQDVVFILEIQRRVHERALIWKASIVKWKGYFGNEEWKGIGPSVKLGNLHLSD